MDNYHQTKKDYQAGANWHFKKTMAADWSEQLAKFLKMLKGGKVLDAGCGAPRDIKIFLKHKLKVECVDYSRAAINKWRALYPQVKFQLADFSRLEAADGYYDGVWACASLVNIEKKDLPAVLRELSRVLKPGGAFFASVKQGRGEKMVNDNYGQRLFSFYSLAELKKYFKRAGLKIKQSEIIADQTPGAKSEAGPNWLCVYGKK